MPQKKSEKSYDERSYLAWLVVYDKILYVPDMPCDVAYEICLAIADMFLNSAENDPTKPLYDAFWNWFLGHTRMINQFMEDARKANPV